MQGIDSAHLIDKTRVLVGDHSPSWLSGIFLPPYKSSVTKISKCVYMQFHQFAAFPQWGRMWTREYFPDRHWLQWHGLKYEVDWISKKLSSTVYIAVYVSVYAQWLRMAQAPLKLTRSALLQKGSSLVLSPLLWVKSLPNLVFRLRNTSVRNTWIFFNRRLLLLSYIARNRILSKPLKENEWD